MKLFSASAAALLAAAGLSAAANAQCYAVSAEGDPELLEGYTLAEETAREGLMPPPPVPETASGVLCVRDTVVPDANDFEILRHGMPLYIRSGEGEEVTVLALGYRDGNYVVQLPQGEITEEERAEIVAALEGFNAGEAALNAYLEAQAQGETPQ
ncbi:hypothetical protein E5163_08545 [Marinicauda algicola]|uniref:Uncharacterized protein n=1 Tax=Marinicauda algicola TaxID=2029849 RepID=A0A4S2H1K9_9PROT|nr:hypothetical protein [Marinicauda algicola]TGY89161.1 hypothetical protein E5163_08545 [Marinicauda algicola]